MIISNLYVRHLLLLLLGCSLALGACDHSDDAGQSTTRPARQAKAHAVETMPASMQQVQSRLTTSGTIEAGTKVRLYNEVSARIRYLPFHEGDAVTADTVVIGLDDDVIQAELDKATAGREQAKIDYERLKKLKKQLASDDEVARAHTAYDIAVAEEQLQQSRLDKTIIKAPFDGLITERHFEPGDVVPLHSHILTVIDPESLQVTIRLAENWISRIRMDDPVDIQIDALAGAMHSGLIKRIHPTIDANTRKGTVEIEFQPVPFGARAGQLARVYLKTAASSRLVVPANALHHDARGAYVYVVDGNNAAGKIYVQKGAQYGNTVEIVSGLDLDEPVVIKGFNGLRHGKKVEVRNTNHGEVAGSS